MSIDKVFLNADRGAYFQRGLENVNFLSAHFSSSFGSHFLLFWLILPPPNTAAGRLHISVQGGGNVSLRRRKYEDKEEEI